MSKGLALTRSTKENNNEIQFRILDSAGQWIEIKQTLIKIKGRQARIYIEAPSSVEIIRSELI